MNLKDLLEEISRMTSVINSTRDARDALLGQWARAASPLKEGEFTSACGYSHTGKKCRVLKVLGKFSYRGDPQICIVAAITKADGMDGKNVVTWNIDA